MDNTQFTSIYAKMYGNNGTTTDDGFRTGNFRLNGADGITRGLPTNHALYWKLTVNDWSSYTMYSEGTPFNVTGNGVTTFMPLVNNFSAPWTRIEYINQEYALALADSVMLQFNSSVGNWAITVSGYDQYKNKLVSYGGATYNTISEYYLFVSKPFKWITSISVTPLSGATIPIWITGMNAFELPYTDYGWMSPIITVNGAVYLQRSESTPMGTQLYSNLENSPFVQSEFSGANTTNYFYANFTNNITAEQGLARPVIYLGTNTLPTNPLYITGISAVYGYGVAPYFPLGLLENAGVPEITQYAPYEYDPNSPTLQNQQITNRNIIGRAQFAGDAINPWTGWRG